MTIYLYQFKYIIGRVLEDTPSHALLAQIFGKNHLCEQNDSYQNSEI
jgi:hypothetical protein